MFRVTIEQLLPYARTSNEFLVFGEIITEEGLLAIVICAFGNSNHRYVASQQPPDTAQPLA